MNVYFGENLKKLRIQRKMTQEKLADFLGVSFQAISKWERGDTLPDICMLPTIASFFNVSTDYLLGVDKSEQEKKIQEYIDLYYNLWQQSKYDDVRRKMKAAIKEFPGDYRLLVRYLNAVIQCGCSSNESASNIRNEVEAAYDKIQNHCTTDSIRIWAKKLICQYYKKLCFVENSGVSFDDIEMILQDMPLMQNSRDYLACILYPVGEKKHDSCKMAISELTFLLNSVINNRYHNDKDCPITEKIKAFEALLSIYEILYPEGDYGKNFINVIYSHGYLGRWYYEIKEPDIAISHLKKCVEFARTFDTLPYENKHTSFLLKDMTVKRKDIPFSQGASMSFKMEQFIFSYSDFSNEFLQSEKLIKIQQSLQ